MIREDFVRIVLAGLSHGILLALAYPPYGEVLQFSGSPEMHFLFNPRSIRINRRYAELKRLSYLTRRMATPDQLQDLHFAVSQAI
jgi:hypothetical protein